MTGVVTSYASLFISRLMDSILSFYMVIGALSYEGPLCLALSQFQVGTMSSGQFSSKILCLAFYCDDYLANERNQEKRSLFVVRTSYIVIRNVTDDAKIEVILAFMTPVATGV